MNWRRHVLFVNAAIEGRYRDEGLTIDACRGYTVIDASRIQQIEDYGRADEHLLRRWLVSPMVNHLSIDSLTTTLLQTRLAVDMQDITLAAREQDGRN